VQAVRFDALEPEAGWSDEDPTIGSRDAYVTHWATGSAASAVIYFEIEPGRHLGRHVHSGEETVVVMEGSVEISVGHESERLDGAGLAVAPALVPHDVRNVGSERARCVGVFAGSSVVTVYDAVLQPAGSRVQGTPTEPDAD